MSNKHTPGPWSYRDYGPGYAIGAGLRGTCMATIERNARDALANARLIAAAPEMYALLLDFSGDPEDNIPLIDKARELLAKIEGKQP